jgi:DNA-binding MarR family transcriptional regulator
MGKINLSKSNFELWLSLGKAHHFVDLARQKELNQYGIPHRQTHVLRTIKDLGTNATLAEIAKAVDRKPHVISSQTITMEKDGLIRRIRATPKSSLLRI